MSVHNEKQKKMLGLDKNIFFVGLTSFLMDTMTKMIYAVMPLFLMTLGLLSVVYFVKEAKCENLAPLGKISFKDFS